MTGGRGGDTGWLVALCIARGGASVMSMAFPTVLAAVQTEWGLSNRAAGSISSASQAGTALSLVVLSAMADYWGPRAVFLVSSAVAVVVALALPVLAQGQVSAFLLFFVMAVAVAGSYTPGVMLIAGRFEPGRRGGAVGWFLASSSLGYVLALAVGGWVMASAGWRAALWALALGPLICLAVSLGLFPARRPTAAAVAAPRFSLDTGLRGNRAGQFIVAGYVFHSWELLGMWAWTPAFMAAVLMAHGVSPERSAGWGAGLSALFHVMGIVAGSTGGWLSDRWGRTAVIAWMMAVSTLCSFTFGWMLETPLLAVALLGCLYGYAALGDSPVYSTAITETVPASRLGSALAVRSLLGFGAGAISPWVFGWMLDLLGGRESTSAWGWAFSMLGVGGVFGLVTILWLRRLPEARRLAGGRR